MKKIKNLLLLTFVAFGCNCLQAQVSDTLLQGFAPMPMGAAVSAGIIKTNQQYRRIVTTEYNSITAENAMKFGVIHPGENTYNWADADTIVNIALQTGKRIHGHTLLWHNNVPAWLTNFSGDSAAWENVMRTHILTVVGRYKNIIASWDVVNEAVADDGTMRNTIWRQKLGANYIERAFIYAHQADPNAVLFYNDYNHESSSNSFAKLITIKKLIDTLLAHNIPIHGAGMQMHINKNTSNVNIGRAIDSMVATGLKIHISELDIAVNPESNQSLTYNTTVAAQQFAKFKYVATKLRSIPAAQNFGITSWNVTDADSWIPGNYSRPDFPLLFNALYQKKNSYQGFKDGLTTIFPYELSSGESLNGGTYEDLGNSGNAITTDFSGNAIDFDDDNSSVQNIGFNFKFNGSTYSTFVLNTNGYIKLGNAAAFAANYYYASVNANSNSVITTTDVDVIYPYNHNLVASTIATTEYRVSTTGNAGSRVCTVQFKNVADPYQYSNMNFQIKLYEGSNVIEFVYGTWTANPAKTPVSTTAAVGIKGALPAQSLNVSKGSLIAWGNALNPAAVFTFRAGDYAAAGPQFNSRNDVLPTPGKAFRFTPSVALPLKLVNFYAVDKTSAVTLNWSTQNEINTRHFAVQRSFDGLSFTTIATINAAGNSTALKNYMYNDAGAGTAKAIYYRLQQVDIDGTAKYSPIIKINRTAKSILIKAANPFNNTLMLNIQSREAGKLMLQLTDVSGRIAWVKTLHIQAGAQFTSLSTNGLLPGVYLLSSINSTQVQTIKLIKN